MGRKANPHDPKVVRKLGGRRRSYLAHTHAHTTTTTMKAAIGRFADGMQGESHQHQQQQICKAACGKPQNCPSPSPSPLCGATFQTFCVFRHSSSPVLFLLLCWLLSCEHSLDAFLGTCLSYLAALSRDRFCPPTSQDTITILERMCRKQLCWKKDKPHETASWRKHTNLPA